MKNWLKLNHTTRTIIMDKTFAKFAENTMSAEYAHLQSVRRDYPTYTVERRHIKKNAKQEHYHGLTYTYMEYYIASHGSAEDRRTYDEMKLISQCHSKGFRYPVIKSWFLERFPEIKMFGVEDTTEENAPDSMEDTNANITELPVAV